MRARGWKLATAESCTGGLIAAECTSVAGSSDWFERGFVTYSNESKVEALGVAAALIAGPGAVSAEVARAMAEGALAHSRADLAVAVTGIAGPGGATEGKPVGTVWLAIARRGARARVAADAGAGERGGGGGAAAGADTEVKVVTELLSLSGERAQVREQTVRHALQRLLACARPS
ncbi:MAG: CinA family protein [Burkholderiaceae bacterium]